MRIAITGGTGFVGRHLARELARNGHEVVLVARGHDRRDPSLLHEPRIGMIAANTHDVKGLQEAFAGCASVAHCAGINREIGSQTYESVHVQGTASVVTAARGAGVEKVVMLSFLRARPNCGSGYHESKWQAEQLVGESGLDFTIVKASMTYGRGDHMLDHLSHLLYTAPVFVTVGLRERIVRPVAVQDLVTVLVAALTENRLSHQTVAVMGPESVTLSQVARRVDRLTGRPAVVVRAPALFNRAVASLAERFMRIPLASKAQVRMLQEGLDQAWGDIDTLPDDLVPRTPLSDDVLRAGLPPAGSFTFADLRLGGTV